MVFLCLKEKIKSKVSPLRFLPTQKTLKIMGHIHICKIQKQFCCRLFLGLAIGNFFSTDHALACISFCQESYVLNRWWLFKSLSQFFLKTVLSVSVGSRLPSGFSYKTLGILHLDSACLPLLFIPRKPFLHITSLPPGMQWLSLILIHSNPPTCHPLLTQLLILKTSPEVRQESLPQKVFDLILSCMLNADALSLPFSFSAWVLLFSPKT